MTTDTRNFFLWRALGSGGLAFIPIWCLLAAQPFIWVYASYDDFLARSSLVIFAISSLLILRGTTNKTARFQLLFFVTATLFMVAGNYGIWFGENSDREGLIFLICSISLLDALRRESGEWESDRAHRLFRVSEIMLVATIPLMFILIGIITFPIGLFLFWLALTIWSVEQWNGYKRYKEGSSDQRFGL